MAIIHKLYRFFLIVFLLTANDANAWGPLAHKAVCDAAWRQLDKPLRRELNEYLQLSSFSTFAESCVWADAIRNQPDFSWHKPLHYVNVPRHAISVVREDCFPVKESRPTCLLNAIDYFRQLAVEGSTPKARGQAILMLAHLIADLHQPLHVGYADDRGGTRRQVIFEGKLMSLHSVWDSDILYCGYQGNWRRLGKQLYRQRHQMPEVVDDIERWATESLTLTRQIYSITSSTLPKDYCQQFYPLAERRLLQASVRLAALLRQALAPNEAHKVQSAPH